MKARDSFPGLSFSAEGGSTASPFEPPLAAGDLTEDSEEGVPGPATVMAAITDIASGSSDDRQIVEAMGGMIAVERRSGLGSFSVAVPLDPATPLSRPGVSLR